MSMLVVVDQVLASWPARDGIGLGVLVDDLDVVGLAADGEALGERLAGEFEHVAVGFAEAGERAGARADEADLERRIRPRGEGAVRAGGHGEATAPADTNSPRRDIGSPVRPTMVNLAFICFLPESSFQPWDGRIQSSYTFQAPIEKPGIRTGRRLTKIGKEESLNGQSERRKFSTRWIMRDVIGHGDWCRRTSRIR